MSDNIRISGNAPELQDVLPKIKVGRNERLSLALYSSPESLAEHVTTVSRESCWRQSAWDNSEEFSGSRDMSHAIELCREGWREGAERVARLRDKITAAHPMTRKLARWDVAGAYPSVARAVSGNPLHMRRMMNDTSRKRPVLTLLSDMSANGMVEGKAITNRAAVVAAIVDVIEDSGFACQVVTYSSSKANDVHQVCAVTVKESDHPADAGKLAFGLGHASMFRRLAWVPIMESRFTEALGPGLGSSTALDGDVTSNTFTLPSANNSASMFATEELAATKGLEFLLGALRDQGCPAIPAIDQAA